LWLSFCESNHGSLNAATRQGDRLTNRTVRRALRYWTPQWLMKCPNSDEIET
jgi:hypothetical protein